MCLILNVAANEKNDDIIVKNCVVKKEKNKIDWISVQVQQKIPAFYCLFKINWQFHWENPIQARSTKNHRKHTLGLFQVAYNR